MKDDTEALRRALNGCLYAMEMQEKREAGLWHISAATMRHTWVKAIQQANEVISAGAKA